MSYNLTIIERMVLECLSKFSKNLCEIEEKTGIEKIMLSKVMQSLLSKNLISLNDQRYQLNIQHNKLIRRELNDSTSLLCEVNEIISSCIRNKLETEDANSFKLKKVNMSEREEKIYKGLLYNLESFLESLSKSDHIREQKIIFWGEGNYEVIKNSILNY